MGKNKQINKIDKNGNSNLTKHGKSLQNQIKKNPEVFFQNVMLTRLALQSEFFKAVDKFNRYNQNKKASVLIVPDEVYALFGDKTTFKEEDLDADTIKAINEGVEKDLAVLNEVDKNGLRKLNLDVFSIDKWSNHENILEENKLNKYLDMWVVGTERQ